MTMLQKPLVPLEAHLLIPFLLVLVFVPLLVPSNAHAEEPWWRLTAGARPTYIHHEAVAGSDDVQEITVKGTVGPETENKFILAAMTPRKVEECLENPPEGCENAKGEQLKKIFDVGVSAAELRSGLEEIGGFGPGSVEVTGGPPTPPTSGETIMSTYVVKFTGSLAERPIEPLNTEISQKRIPTTELIVTEATKGVLAKPDAVLVDTAVNVGNANTSGEIKLTDNVPAGLKVVSAEAVIPRGLGASEKAECSLEIVPPATSATPVCVLKTNAVQPFSQIEMRVGVDLEPETSVPPHEVNESKENEFVISGGGVAEVAIHHKLKLSDEPVPFGMENYGVAFEEEGGSSDEQAGSHPFQTTFTFNLNQGPESINTFGFPVASPVALTKDLNDLLPPGLIGNPEPFPRCSLAQFFARPNPTCKAESVVGIATTTVNEGGHIGISAIPEPIYNLEPQAGEPARFGFLPVGVSTPVYIDTSVRAGGDYGITAGPKDITQEAGFLSSVVTFWGVPGAASHDQQRGYNCAATYKKLNACQLLEEGNPPPFWLMPTFCGRQLQSSVEVDSWSEPGKFKSLSSEPLPTLDGCNRLPFEPSLTVKPDVEDTSSASGLVVNVKVPQSASLNATGLSEAAIRDTTVALPAGVQINPSGGNGLEACSEGLIGFEGFKTPALEPGVEVPGFFPRVPGSITAKQNGETAAFEPGLNFCSNASKIGTVRIKLPVLEHELTGAVYLADQEANPFGSLIAMYVIAEDPVSGVLVKLPGEVQLCKGAGETIDGQTCQGLGQIMTTFLNTPQAPAEEIEFHFFGGERAPLATPARCGSYTTTTAIVPWSAKESTKPGGPFNPEEVVNPSTTFTIDHGPNGDPCPGAKLPFNPTATGGATNLQAGAFSPLTVTMSRADGEQNLKSLEAKLPPGLSGILTGVELCPEPQANEGECGPNSLIGEATVSVGVGSDPYTVTGGRFYLSGPYNGTGGCTVGTTGCAPFGVTFEVPAKAGPFDLANTRNNHPPCDCIVTRGKIEINPLTSALTITSDPPGSPDSIPTSIEGIPLEIQHINATTTRGNFQFNPTNCSKMELIGNLALSEGGTNTITTPFQVTNCAALKFEPKFSVTTSGKTSKAEGASLTAKVTYPNVPQGTDADIAKVKVELPLQLPSRLTTLQKACTDMQFEANPAGCPSASKIGDATVHTPLIPVPLTGPAIFVSHGGEAFPSVTMVLQGYGITIDLVGTTFISTAGITSTTFKTVPDQPFSSFELTLPEGPYSALAAYLGKGKQNFCGQKLTMPTVLTAQNGAVIKQNTPITITGCPKHKAKQARKSKKHHKGNAKQHGKAKK